LSRLLIPVVGQARETRIIPGKKKKKRRKEEKKKKKKINVIYHDPCGRHVQRMKLIWAEFINIIIIDKTRFAVRGKVGCRQGKTSSLFEIKSFISRVIKQSLAHLLKSNT
jgi:hypothetical protein